MISRAEESTRPRDWAANGATGRAARTLNACEACERGDEFERSATGTGGQIVVANAMSEFKDEVVIRREDSHRLYEFLFFVHFHANSMRRGVGQKRSNRKSTE
jgi:hypothetical protein